MIDRFKEIVRYPFKEKQWWVKILLGIVPVANIGYLLRVLRSGKDGEELKLPAWDKWEDLFIKGLMGFVIALVYSLPLILLNFIGLIPYIGVLFRILGFLGWIVYGPILSIGLCQFIEFGNLKNAFNLKPLIEKFKTRAKDYIIIGVIFMIAYSILGFMSMIIILAVCLAPIFWLLFYLCGFYLAIISNRLYGEIYSGQEVVPEGPAGAGE